MTFTKTILLTSVAFSLAVTPVSAMTVTPNPTRVAIKEQVMEKRTELKKDRAMAEIDRRVTSLTNLITRVNGMKRLTAEQKTALVAKINQEMTALKALKTKIEADTDLATLTADKKSIIDSYRVYVLFIPQVTIVAHADQVLQLADEMGAKTTDASATALLNEAKAAAQKAIDGVLALTPEGYPANKTALETARGDLKTARTDLRKAWVMIKGKK